MAYDPAARRQSNSAMIIGIVALMVVAGATLAYFATRHTEPETVAIAPVETRRETVVNNVPVPAPNPGPGAVVVSPPVVASPPVVVSPSHTTTRIERNTTTVRDRVVPAPSSNSSANPAPGRSSSNANVTVNVPPASSSSSSSTAPSADQPANSGSDTTSSTTDSSSNNGY